MNVFDDGRSEAPDVCVKADRWERALWSAYMADNAQDMSELSRRVESSDKDDLPGLPAFARELFARVYSVNEKERMKCAGLNAWHESAHKALDQLDGFTELKGAVQGDDFLSAVMVNGFVSSFLERLPSVPGDLAKASKSARTDSQEGEPTNGPNDGQEASSLDSSPSGEAYGQVIDGQTARVVARQALSDATEAVESAKAMCYLYGCGSEDASTKRVNKNALKTIKASAKLKALAKMTGRMKAICAGVRSKRSKFGRTEAHGTTLGRDIPNLLSVELVKLQMGGALAAEVAGRIASGRAMQTAFRGIQKEASGPIMVYVDSSGSMQAPFMGSTYEIWSKAVALAFLDVAFKEKRPFIFRQFGSRIEVGGIQTDGKKPIEPGALLAEMELFHNGGTVFSCIREDVSMQIAKWPHAKRSDVVVITDGLVPSYSRHDFCSESGVELKEMRKNGLRIFSVFLGTKGDGALLKHGDKVTSIIGNDDSSMHEFFKMEV